jgi:GTP-binding protein YchF
MFFVHRVFPLPPQSILRNLPPAMLKAGIVGLPNVGKSTLFNAVTRTRKAEAANYPFCTIEPNQGVVVVPDERLAVLSKLSGSQKLVPAAIKLVDIAGIVKGASEGQGLGNKFLSHIREVDAILQVVRCFDDPDVIHVAGGVNPVSDIETIEIELMLADLQVLDNSLSKAERSARSGDKEAKLRAEVIKKCLAHLQTDQPLRKCTFDENEQAIVTGYGLMTAKPVLYVANVDENDLEGTGPLVQQVRKFAEQVGASVVPVCAKLEAEVAELDEADRLEMLASVGLTEPALGALTRAAYKALGLQSYFTAGEMEVRAWTVPVGATAPQAAGVIHTDFEKGFIRAEVYQLAELEQYKSEKEIRAAGKLRVEGKAYIMQDGDICHFLTNG